MLLLQPVSFILQIKRNLSTAWFRGIPDIEMSGRLKRVDVLLNQEDYAMIMSTLSENLGESVEDGGTVTTQTVAKVDRKSIAEEPSKTTTCKLLLKYRVISTNS